MQQATITDSVLAETLSFEEYLQLTDDILEQRVERAGIYLNDSTFRYTRSNLERMKKVLDTIALNQKLYNLLSDLEEEWIWLVISEPWCGDASWGVPALCMIASASDKIDFRILLRDTHPDIIQAYQTAGTDSIPKLVCLRKDDLSLVGTWGPRPAELHEMVLKFKDDPAFDYRESVRRLHAWFEADMTKSTQDELTVLIKRWIENNN
ncbi:MAG TPA: thioredoxin family protein [Chitinophagales bacterium]|nr:thioredoxin family protein [Chitinophagales bacterium]